MLSSLSTREFINLRERMPEDFEAFRSAVRDSVKVSIEASKDSPADKVAELVWHERLKPAVADVERKMKVNRKSFTAKSIAAATMGFAAAGVTLMTSIPWVVGILGTAAMTATIPIAHFNDLWKDRQQVRSAPLYFLWKAEKEHAD